MDADNAAGQGFNHLEFKVVVEPPDGQTFSVVLLAPSRQEKAAWTSDISQVCLTVLKLVAISQMLDKRGPKSLLTFVSVYR